MISDVRGHVAYMSETASLLLSYINGVGDGSTVKWTQTALVSCNHNSFIHVKQLLSYITQSIL